MMPTFTGSAEAKPVAANNLPTAMAVRYLISFMNTSPDVGSYLLTTRTGSELSARRPVLSR